MIKSQIRYSWIYSRMLAPELKIEDFREFVEKSKPFEEKIKKILSKIKKIIEKNHDGKWKYDFIPIYLTPINKISISDPLTLVYKFHDRYSIVTLCHELLHNHLSGKKFENPKILHEFMEPINNKIVLELEKETGLKLSDKLEKFNIKIKEMYK